MSNLSKLMNRPQPQNPLEKLLKGRGVLPHEWANWGVALVESDYLDCDDSKNAHIALAKRGPNGADISETICGEGVKRNVKYERLDIQSDSEMRTRVADCQNEGTDICGKCVSRLYADTD
jgi:hypothetical protein